MNNIYTVVIVAIGSSDVIYILKLIDKIKNKNILIITQTKYFDNKIFNILKEKKIINFLFLNEIFFPIDFKIKSFFTQFINIIQNYIILLRVKRNISSIARVYFFNEFNSFLTILSFPILSRFKYRFIRSIKLLKNTNPENEDIKNFLPSIRYYILAKRNLFLLSIVFRNIFISFYELDYSFFKKKKIYTKDYYKIIGFGLNSGIKFLKIKSFNFSKMIKKKIKRKNPLYLFAPIEQSSSFGINITKSYHNIYSYLKNNYHSIDIKIHPSMRDYPGLLNLKKLLNYKLLNYSFPAEYYINQYDVVIVNFVSTSIRAYLENNNKTKTKFISLVDLLIFDDKKVKEKFEQYYDVLYDGFEKKVKKIKF